MTGSIHIPVMADEVWRNIYWKEDGIYVDGTAGGGGHLNYMVEKSGKDSIFICFEVDPELASLLPSSSRIIVLNTSYVYLRNWMDYMGIDGVDGILIDCGISSYHVERQDRGFSYKHDAFLDMRYAPYYRKTASDVINTYDYESMVRIFREYGDIEYAEILAKSIIKARKVSPIRTTRHFISVIMEMVEKYRMYKVRRDIFSEYSRIFQCLRIEVNNEIDNLRNFLEYVGSCLNVGGRIVVITYHSVEDRLVKKYFERYSKEDDRYVYESYGPFKPSKEEVKRNRRSRSAKLRVLCKKMKK